jgi:hypothetical protein
LFTIRGGILGGPVDLTIRGFLPVSDEQLEANRDNAVGLGLKGLEPGPIVPLAIVGGGSSIEKHVETLQKWSGDVWAINGAWKWCRDNGIDATFVSVDPHPIVAKWAEGATRAILHAQCPVESFDALKGADVRLFDSNGCSGTTVAAAITAGAKTRHNAITLFGCESSYQLGKSHAYMDENLPEQMIVSCEGTFYLTRPDFYFQAQKLAELIRGLDGYVKEEGGGLLRAFIKCPDHWILWMSDEITKGLKPVREL